MEYQLVPYPKTIQENVGKYTGDIKYVSDGDVLHDTIAQFFPSDNGVSTLVLSYDETLEEEEYILSLNLEEIEICAKTSAGHYYGAQTLMQLRQQFGDSLPYLVIRDAPKSKHRGVQVNYAQANVRFHREWLSYFIEKCGQWRINHLYLYFEWNYSFESISGLKNPFYANRTDIEYIVNLAKAHNITIVPEFNFFGHSAFLGSKEKFASMLENETLGGPNASGADICPCNENNFEIVKMLLEEICDVFPSPIIHMGGDEVSKIGECSDCAKLKSEIGKLGIYLRYYQKINDILKAKGKKLGLWGDMILQLCDGSPFWVGREIEQEFVEKNLELLYALRDNLIVYDWWYTGVSKLSLDFFRKHGIKTIAATSTMGCYCSCLNPEQFINSYNFYEYAQDIDTYGVLCTDWINHLGYHAEHMTLHFAMTATIAWSGCQNGFTTGITKEEFEKWYCRYEYGTEKMVGYIRFSGDFESELFSSFESRLRGVGLRHFVFQFAEPLSLYCKIYPSLSKAGAFEDYEKQVDKLVSLWEDCEPFFKSKYNRVMRLPVVLHTTVCEYYKIMDDVYKTYHNASLCQYEDQSLFDKLLKYCAKRLRGLTSIYDRVIDYAKEGFMLVGNDYLSIIRLRTLQKNIKRLQKFIVHLRKSHRPIPSFTDIRKNLLGYLAVGLYDEGELDWALENSKYRSVTYYNNGSVFINDVDCFNVCRNT